jgi:hypothetical protein
MGKGSKRRPRVVARAEADLRWDILREKDPDKKATLIATLDKMLEEADRREQHWAAYTKKTHEYGQ